MQFVFVGRHTVIHMQRYRLKCREGVYLRPTSALYTGYARLELCDKVQVDKFYKKLIVLA